MNIEELVIISEPMLKHDNDGINKRLSAAANYSLAAFTAAGQMEDAIGRDVTKDEAQETAKIALKFMNENFDGDAHAGIAFLQDALQRSPAIGKLDIEQLVESGAAAQMVELSKNDPETYGQMLYDLSDDSQLLAAAQQSPKQAIDNYLQMINAEPEVIIAGNATPAQPPATSPAQAPPVLDEQERTFLVGLSGDEASDVLTNLGTGFLGNGNPAQIDNIVTNLLQKGVSIGSTIIGSGGGDWFKNFCSETLGCGIEAIRLTENGLQVTMDDRSPPDILGTLQEIGLIRPMS